MAHKQSEIYYRSLIENSADVVSIFDQNLVRRYTSPGVEQVLGFKPEELLGKSGLELIHPEDIPDLVQIVKQLIQNPASVISGTFRIRHRNGAWHAMESVARNLLANPAVSGIVLNSRDVTQRRSAESEVKNQRRRLDNIVANVPGVVWEEWRAFEGADHRTNFVSGYVEKMLGYSVVEWLATPNFWLSIVHPDDHDRIKAESEGHFDRRQGGKLEFRWIAKDGRILWVESN